MLTIEPTGAVLGATVRGLDLVQPLHESDMGRLLLALGRHGVLRFPDQELDLASLKRFSELFGVADPAREYPEIGILSNLKEDGKYIGSPDAGQDWHTDMTYREVPGFVNVLYGIRIPHRDGKPLDGTEFSNMHLAHDDLNLEKSLYGALDAGIQRAELGFRLQLRSEAELLDNLRHVDAAGCTARWIGVGDRLGSEERLPELLDRGDARLRRALFHCQSDR